MVCLFAQGYYRSRGKQNAALQLGAWLVFEHAQQTIRIEHLFLSRGFVNQQHPQRALL